MTEYQLAPIVLFVYNRPHHTELTLKALKNNKLANESILYIYCDGLKKNVSIEVKENFEKVRNIVRREKWCKEVVIIESGTNKGLATSIKRGVSNVIEKYGKVIVMEDDLITSPAFLTFMNKSLYYYSERKSVFSVTAYNLPSTKMEIPEDYEYDVYVNLRNGSWGWGTWLDRWNQVDWFVKSFDTLKKVEEMRLALNRRGDDVFDMLTSQQNRELDIWSIQFTMAHFINHAVAIAPTISYVDNIGLDGSGENCVSNDTLRNNNLNVKEDIVFLDILYEDRRLINAFYNAYCRVKRPIWQKIINRIRRSLTGKNLYVIKRPIYK